MSVDTTAGGPRLESFSKISVLFVDDEPAVLAGLETNLRHMRNVWKMRFMTSGAEAMACVRRERADVVVSDWLMVGMS